MNMTVLDESITKTMDYATFVKIISQIPSEIFYKDKDLRYRFSSHCWAQLNTENIIGKTDAEIRIDKENVRQAEESDREVIRTGKENHYFIESEIDGKTDYLELIKAPIFDNDGEVMGIVGLINNVTEKAVMRKKIEGMMQNYEKQCIELEGANGELKRSLDQIEEFHKAHKLFTSSMNHELRSPLNSIIGILQLLLEDETLSESQRQNITAAFNSSEFMLSIVNDLLDFAKFETNEFSINAAPFNLREMLDGVNYINQLEASSKNLIFEMHIQDGMEDFLLGDEVRIKQIINNLVSNSIKYTDEGRVDLSVSYTDGKLTIRCADTGQGISEEDLPKLFEPYTRFNEKNNTKIQGTGLGMPIVKRIIDKMKGEITVESTVDVGSTFTVVIPLDIAKEPGTDNISDSAEDELCEIDYSRLTALCVDDSKVNADVMVALLNKIGMSAEAVNSGWDAIAKAEYNHYDIIFMDHMMPEIDGIETFKTIKEKSRINADTPVVMLTGNSGDDYEEYYRDLGADGYLIKPVLMGRIVDVVNKVCR